nr:uncharacterized protein LOC107429364 isoform X13 [Ziziphus jujuba var. spinosa]
MFYISVFLYQVYLEKNFGIIIVSMFLLPQMLKNLSAILSELQNFQFKVVGNGKILMGMNNVLAFGSAEVYYGWALEILLIQEFKDQSQV